MQQIKLVEKALQNIDNDDDSVETLENAMGFYCSTYDICEGIKHAIMLTVRDQYENHANEQDDIDLHKLIALLNK